jgi:gliding motility-associated-like protein
VRKHLLILSFFIVTGIAASGQPYPSRLGRFQVDQKRGCAPFTITLTNLLAGDCTPGKPCVMDYESNNANQQNQFTHTYTIPGTYTLKVLYQSVGQDDIVITVDQNTQPNFEIYSCANQQGYLKVVDNNYDQYVIDFNNDGTPEYVLPFSNNILAGPSTYPLPAPPQPTTYTMAVRGRKLNAADNCAAKTQPFTMKTFLPTPTISQLTSIDVTSVKIDFTTVPNVQYRMEVALNGSTNFQFLQSVYGLTTLTIPNLKIDDNYYCFRLSAVDPCNGAITPSTIVCTNKFTVTAQSDVNQIVMNTGNISAVSNFSINRNKVSFFNTLSTTFNDTNIICKTDYCYQITTIYSGGSKSVSLEKCVKAFSNKIPTSITDVTSVVSAGGVSLGWTQDPKFSTANYSVLRSSNGSNLSFLSLTPTTSYADNSYNIDGKFCYQVNYTDKCDNIALPGIVACPIRLSGTLEKSNAVGLKWSAYKGWAGGVNNYTIEKYNVSGAVVKTFTTVDTTLVDDTPDAINQLVRYVVKANANVNGITASVSNFVEFIKEANLYYPTAFSPNADALNDGFRVSGQFINKMNMKIFDRWGGLVFATDKNEPWDGSREGKPMPASTYVWKVEITDQAGRTFLKEGMVALIRN